MPLVSAASIHTRDVTSCPDRSQKGGKKLIFAVMKFKCKKIFNLMFKKKVVKITARRNRASERPIEITGLKDAATSRIALEPKLLGFTATSYDPFEQRDCNWATHLSVMLAGPSEAI